VAPGRPKGTAQPDLPAALQHGDDHDVGDADAADQDRDGAQAEEQPEKAVLAAARAARMPEGRLTRTVSGCAGLAVKGRTAATAWTWSAAARR